MRYFESFKDRAHLEKRMADLERLGYRRENLEIIEPIDLTDEDNPLDSVDNFESAYVQEILDRYDWDEEQKREVAERIQHNEFLLLAPGEEDFELNFVDHEGIKQGIYNEFDQIKEQNIKVHRERLKGNKTREESGAVQVNKRVVTEYQEVDVPVKKEHVVIERNPVGDVLEETELTLAEGEVFRIPIREERLVVTKQVVLTEEILIRKDIVEEIETVTGEVRREVVDIDSTGNVEGKEA